nr:PQQ-binding-like beta-propeller repeat protein [Streptomyces pseudovenezuelae]
MLIATYDYQDTGLRRLTAPAHDAEALAAVLRDPAIAGFEITTLVNEPHHRVGGAIGDFYRDRRRDDLTLLYFTGHGLKDDNGRLYLAMTNTRRDSLLFTAISAEQIDQAMEGCVSRQKVLILDCCYSGAFPAGRLAKADTAVHALERFQGRGRTVLTASDATQYSFEGNQPQGQAAQSVFTRYLVDGLRDGSADLDGDGDITLDELYSYVHDRVVDEMPQQRPKKQDNVEGRTVIARNINWTLPSHLRNAIGSPIANDRIGALDGLAHLHRIGNETVRGAVLDEIRRLADDDSRGVSAAATAWLKSVLPKSPDPPAEQLAAMPPDPQSRSATAPDPSPAVADSSPPPACPTDEVTTQPPDNTETAHPPTGPSPASGQPEPATTGRARPDARASGSPTAPGSRLRRHLPARTPRLAESPAAATTGVSRRRVLLSFAGTVTAAGLGVTGWYFLNSDDDPTREARWKSTAGSSFGGRPVVSGGLVFSSSWEGFLHAVDAATGKQRWKVRVGEERADDRSPAVSGGLVYASGTKCLYALHTDTGEERWRFPTGDNVYSAPTVSGGLVCVTGDDAYLYAVDAVTGKQRWKYATEADSNYKVSPTVSGGLVYVGMSDDLYALDAATGKKRWNYRTFGRVRGRSLSEPRVRIPLVRHGIAAVAEASTRC